MDRHTLFETIEGIVKTRSGLKSAIDPNARFKEDLEIDSLLVVDIVIDIEKRFGISLPDQELVHVSSLDSAVALVERLLSASSASRGGSGSQEGPQAHSLRDAADLVEPGHK